MNINTVLLWFCDLLVNVEIILIVFKFEVERMKQLSSE